MSAKKTQLFVIVDGNAIIHRAYHALPPMTTKDGTMVNAVYGFTSMLLKVIHDLQPTHIAVAFDVAGKTFRDELYDKYKATRVKAEQSLYDQIPLVYEVVQAFGIPIYTKEGYEADDVIGTIVEKLKSRHRNMPVVIVTGDMDMLQLVDDAVRVYELRKGLSDIVIFDAAKVRERYGFGPDRIVDYKALRGDTSDNIPGIKGIGEKTATQLIQTYGGLDDLYEKIRNPKSEIRKKIQTGVLKKLDLGEESARMSKTLAAIRRDVPGIDFSSDRARWELQDRERIVALFQRFDFPSLLRRIPGIEAVKNTAVMGTKTKRGKTTLTRVTGATFAEVFSRLKQAAAWPVKELVSNPDILQGGLIGMVVFYEDRAYIFYMQEVGEQNFQKLFSFFQNPDHTLIGHDVKLFVQSLDAFGIAVQAKLFDVMIASYILNSSTRAHDMKSIVLRELGKELPAHNDQGSLFGTQPEIAAEELAFVEPLYQKYKKALADRGDLGLFDEIEMKLIPVLAEMELNGVAIDTVLLASLSKEIARDIDRVTKKIWKEAGVEFNVASSTQLREVLFEKIKLPLQGIKKGKTGYSTAASELEKLRGLHPVIELIEEHRELAKLQNTYVDVLPTLVNQKTGRVHTSFNQAVAATGRLSSSDPNLQNIPIRTELGRKIRDAFIAEEGYVLVTADYSQIELRIVASLAQDEKMIAIFQEGKDIHRSTAAVINGVSEAQVTKEMRSAAKEVNFGVLYGMGAYGLSARTGISQGEAQDFIRKYFEQFSGVKAYIDQTLVFAKKEGYVETLFGRRRYIPELQADNYQLRAAGERMAVNMPIQGTAADLMKLAMIRVYDSVKKKNWKKEEVKMILQVHDELVFEVKSGLANDVMELLKRDMEGVAKLRVPIEVHVSSGRRWGELK